MLHPCRCSDIVWSVANCATRFSFLICGLAAMHLLRLTKTLASGINPFASHQTVIIIPESGLHRRLFTAIRSWDSWFETFPSTFSTIGGWVVLAFQYRTPWKDPFNFTMKGLEVYDLRLQIAALGVELWVTYIALAASFFTTGAALLRWEKLLV